MQTGHDGHAHVTLLTALPKGGLGKIRSLLCAGNVFVNRLQCIGVGDVIGPAKSWCAGLKEFQRLDDNVHYSSPFFVRFGIVVGARVQHGIAGYDVGLGESIPSTVVQRQHLLIDRIAFL